MTAAVRHPDRAVLLLVLAATLVRIVFAGLTGLGIDESYMIAAGRVPALGYFDHPPLAWWLSHGIAALAGSEAPVVVRLPFILTAAVTTLLLARLGRLLFSPRAGFWTAVVFTLAPLFGVTSATWVLPDGPLGAALAAFLVAVAQALFGPAATARRWWLVAGLAGGLALLSKYTAVLTFAGVALAVATAPGLRRWYARPEPYLAAALAALAFAPVLAWNAAHDWASLGFQGSRAEIAALRPEMALVVLGGGALYLMPWIFAGLGLAAFAALRRGRGDERRWLLAVAGLVPIAFFTVVALWSPDRPLPHWSASGYLTLMPLLGDVLARAEAAGARWVRRTALATAVLLVGAMAAATAELRLGFLEPLAPAAAAGLALQGRDWTALAPAVAATGVLDRPNGFVGAAEWHVAGKAGYALGPGIPLVCLCHDAREFGVVAPAAAFVGGDAVLVVPAGSSRGGPTLFGRWFASLAPAGRVEIGSGAALDLWIGRGMRIPTGGRAVPEPGPEQPSPPASVSQNGDSAPPPAGGS